MAEGFDRLAYLCIGQDVERVTETPTAGQGVELNRRFQSAVALSIRLKLIIASAVPYRPLRRG